MTSPFSVANDPWIAVTVRPDAHPEQLAQLLPGAAPGAPHVTGLRGVLLAAHLLEDLAIAQMPVESTVRRLLTALAARLTGLADRRPDWTAHRDTALDTGRIEPARVQAYFDQHAERLLLSGTDRPWLQDPRLEAECGAPAWAARIDMTRPSGGNAMWDPRIPVQTPVPAAEAAMWLAAWHGYAPSGLGASRTHGGVTSRSGLAAPYRGYLSFFPHIPDSLYATLIASIPAPDYWPAPAGGADHAPWETPLLPDPRSPQAPAGIVSLLTARTTQAVLLQTDAAHDALKAWVAWGAAGELPDATDPYLMPRSETGPVRAVHGSPLWRELPAILQPEAQRANATAYRPTALSTAATMPARWLQRTGVRALSWAQERQERSQIWWSETQPELLALSQEAGGDVQHALRIVATAQAHATALTKALGGAWSEINPGRKPTERGALLGPASTAYREAVTPHVWRAVRDSDYRPPWHTISASIYDQCIRTVAYTPHHMARAAASRAKLIKNLSNDKEQPDA